MAEYLTRDDITARLDYICAAPRDAGRLEMIVRRPAIDAREVLDEGELSESDGLVGDTWKIRGSSRSADGRAHPDMQINVMNARMIEVISPAGFEHFFRRMGALAADGPPDPAAVKDLADRYGLVLEQPDWIDDVVARYSLTPPPGR